MIKLFLLNILKILGGGVIGFSVLAGITYILDTIIGLIPFNNFMKSILPFLLIIGLGCPILIVSWLEARDSFDKRK